MTALAGRVEKGAEVTAGGFRVGVLPPNETVVTKELLASATPIRRNMAEDIAGFSFGDGSDDHLSDANIALFHTSFRYEDREGRFIGQKMYRIDVIVLGPEDALNQIEKVTYLMAPVYPRRIYEIGPEGRDSRFKLKELANGYSIIRAKITFKGKHNPLLINRFIDLIDQPRPD
jgi:hypothetical protein